MIPGPPENKSVPGPRDDAPHAAKPGQRRRARPPVRDVRSEALKAKVKERREHKP